MNIWIVQDGETPPLRPAVRPMRSALLAGELAGRGHDITWWQSTFSHPGKTLLYRDDAEARLESGVAVKMLHAGAYSANVSLRRYWHHHRLAKRFARRAPREPRPDVIVAGFPQIGLAHNAVAYAARRRIPVIVDVRDLWPDIFLRLVPPWLRRPATLLLRREFRQTRLTFGAATSIVGVSRGYVNWALHYAGRGWKPLDSVFHLGYSEFGGESHAGSAEPEGAVACPAGNTVFAFVGSFGRSYQLELVCDVAERLARSGADDPHFVIAGGGQQFESIERRVKQTANVTLRGWLSEAEIRSLLTVADVGLAPCDSAPDTIPNKIGEYLSFGLPVVSSLVGEMEEKVRRHDVGFSYAPGDRRGLENAVRLLAGDRGLRARQSRNAMTLYEREFSALKTTVAYADHVERVGRDSVS